MFKLLLQFTVEIDTEMNEAISKDILNHWELVALAAFAFIRIDSPIMWSDVETMIFKIITWVLINKRKSDQELKKMMILLIINIIQY